MPAMCIASRARLIGGVPSSEPPMNRRKAPEKKALRGSRLSGVALHVMRDAQSSSGAFVPGGRPLPPRVAHARKGHWCGCLAAAPEEQGDDAPSGQEQEMEELVRALAVTYVSTKGGSLFSLEAFIDCVLEGFTNGFSMNDIKAQVSFLGMKLGPQSLTPMDQDVMVSWAALVMNTLQEVGLEAPAGGGLSESDDATYNGLRGFVQQIIGKAAEGLTLQKVLLEQTMVPENERSPSVRIMQQNTRIVFLTLKAAQKARTDQLVADFTETTPSARSGLPDSKGPGFSSTDSERRVAVRLLLAFTGLLIGSPFSLITFAREAHQAYLKGWSVQDLLDQLEDEEYEQTGGIVPFCSGSGETSTGDLAQKINGLLLARFLSLTYITWALAGVTFPARSAKESWAWSDALGVTSTATEASSWAAMVRSTMKLEAKRLSADVSQFLDDDGKSRAPRKQGSSSPAVAKTEKKEEEEEEEEKKEGGGSTPGEGPPSSTTTRNEASVVFIEDPSLSKTSPTISLIKRQTGIIKAALTLVEGEWWTIQEYLPEKDEVRSTSAATSQSSSPPSSSSA